MKNVVLLAIALGFGSVVLAWTQKEAYDSLSDFNIQLIILRNNYSLKIDNYFRKNVGTRANMLDECTNYLNSIDKLDDDFTVMFYQKMVAQVKANIAPAGQKILWPTIGLDGISAYNTASYFTTRYILGLCREDSQKSVNENNQLQDAKQNMNLANLAFNSILRELR